MSRAKSGRKRKRMKPYQIKLRVVGVLSLIAAVLAAFVPFPSRAVSGEAATTWQDQFDIRYTIEIDASNNKSYYVDLIRYTGDANDPPGSRQEESALVAPGALTIPDRAIARENLGVDPNGGAISGLSGNNVAWTPRIGAVNGTEGVFQNKDWLKRIDLTNVVIDEQSTSLKNLFSGCSSLEEYRFESSRVNAVNVKDYSGMFAGCSLLENIAIGNFRSDAVEDVGRMFYDCAAATSIDVSNLKLTPIDGSDETKYTQALNGCENLKEILTPMNVADAVLIELPNSFKNGGDATDTNTYDALPRVSEATADTSLYLTRITDVETLTMTPAAETVEVGQNVTLTLTATPKFAENRDDHSLIVILQNPDPTILTFQAETGVTTVSADGRTATVALTDGTADVTLNAIKNSDGSAVEIAATIATSAATGAATITPSSEITVVDKEIFAQGITLTPKTSTIDLNGSQTLTATIESSDDELPSTETIEWTLENVDDTITEPIGEWTDNHDGTVTVTPTKKAVGQVRLTAKTNKTGYTDYAVIDVTSPYTLELNDNRDVAEVTNRKNSELADVARAPVNGDCKLVVETSSGSVIGSRLGATYDPVSYFTLHTTDENGGAIVTPTQEDFGDVTIDLALPGKMWYKTGLTPQVFACLNSGASPVVSPVASTRVSLSENTEGVRFTVNLGTPATEYAIVMVDAQPDLNITVNDGRDNPGATKRAKVAKTDKTTLTNNLYLQIREIDQTNSTVLYPYVRTHATYQNYKIKHYYVIYMSSDPEGNIPVNNFTEVDVQLSLPTDVTVGSPYLTILTEKTNGTAADFVNWTAVSEGTTSYARFTPTHFSEFAVLDTADDAPTETYTIRTEHTGSGTTAIVSGVGVTSITAPQGYDAAATVAVGTEQVSVTAVEGNGYRFVEWQNANGNRVSDQKQYTFEPTASMDLKAVFEVNDGSSGNAGNSGSSGSSNAGNSGSSGSGGASSSGSSSAADNSSGASATTGGSNSGGGGGQNTGASDGTSGSSGGSNAASGSSDATSGASGVVNYTSGNASDMPTTGVSHMYRVLIVILLLLSGTVELLLSVPAKRRRAQEA